MEGGGVRSSEPISPLRYITDLREHDVGYSMRCGIDLNLRIGAWFSVTPNEVLRGIECVKCFVNLKMCAL